MYQFIVVKNDSSVGIAKKLNKLSEHNITSTN